MFWKAIYEGRRKKKKGGRGKHHTHTVRAKKKKKKKKRQQALVFSLPFCEHWGGKNSSSKRNPTNLAHDIIL